GFGPENTYVVAYSYDNGQDLRLDCQYKKVGESSFRACVGPRPALNGSGIGYFTFQRDLDDPTADYEVRMRSQDFQYSGMTYTKDDGSIQRFNP
ncbi:MAG: hypothetical protein KDD25_10205, partial [Bdellovibrionales bacterium]|nr:hypothetical protein [Bdellovibrionales bacterium]